MISYIANKISKLLIKIFLFIVVNKISYLGIIDILFNIYDILFSILDI